MQNKQNKTKAVAIEVLVDVLVCIGCGKEHETVPASHINYERRIEGDKEIAAFRSSGYPYPSGWSRLNGWTEWLCPDCVPRVEAALRGVLGTWFTLERFT